MFHTAARSVSSDRSRKKSEEFQYSNVGFDLTEEHDLTTTCMEENLSESTSSETDIDSVVEQYRDQTRVTNLKNLDSSVSCSLAPEPTPSTSFRAYCCIIVLMVVSLSVSLMINLCNLEDHFAVIIIVMLSILFSTIVQSLLICLPQNKKLDRHNECCAKIPSLPWIPSIASMMSCSLFVHVLMATWKACIGSFIMGKRIFFNRLSMKQVLYN